MRIFVLVSKFVTYSTVLCAPELRCRTPCMTGARDETAEDSRDEVIRQQQIEISRLSAENEALRARLRGVGLDASSPGGSSSGSMRRVLSGSGLERLLSSSGRSLSKLARSPPFAAASPPATPPSRPLSEINSGAEPTPATPTRMRPWNGSMRSSASLTRLDEMDIARHGGPLEPTEGRRPEEDWAAADPYTSVTLSPITRAAVLTAGDDDVGLEI